MTDQHRKQKLFTDHDKLSVIFFFPQGSVFIFLFIFANMPASSQGCSAVHTLWCTHSAAAPFLQQIRLLLPEQITPSNSKSHLWILLWLFTTAWNVWVFFQSFCGSASDTAPLTTTLICASAPTAVGGCSSTTAPNCCHSSEKQKEATTEMKARGDIIAASSLTILIVRIKYWLSEHCTVTLKRREPVPSTALRRCLMWSK